MSSKLGPEGKSVGWVVRRGRSQKIAANAAKMRTSNGSAREEVRPLVSGMRLG
jgi:hypothetical protein